MAPRAEIAAVLVFVKVATSFSDVSAARLAGIDVLGGIIIGVTEKLVCVDVEITFEDMVDVIIVVRLEIVVTEVTVVAFPGSLQELPGPDEQLKGEFVGSNDVGGSNVDRRIVLKALTSPSRVPPPPSWLTLENDIQLRCQYIAG